MVQATDELTARFRSPDLAAAFRARYDEALARWPDDTGAVDVPAPFGTTHVQVCGPPDAPPLVLLHGGGCTSASWFANAGALSRAHRVHAVDQPGDAGLSVPSGRPIRRPADFMAWLDGLLDGLGLESAAFCGHSYGAWLALSYALHAPGRVRRLALLDPTACFGGLAPGYRLRAVPLLARPAQARARAILTWESARAEPAAVRTFIGKTGAELGPLVRDAVAKYQIATNQDVTGSLSPETLQSFGLAQPVAS